MRQSSIEWLEEQINKYSWCDSDGFMHVSISIIDFNKAKEMQKQEVIDASEWFTDITIPKELKEEIYNETYNIKR